MPENNQLPDPVPPTGWGFLPPATPSAPQFVEIPGVRRKHKAMLWGLLGLVVLIFLFTAGVAATSGASTPIDVAIPLLIVGAGFVFVLFIFALILIPMVLFMRRRQAVDKAAQPHTVAFLTQRTPELRAALTAIGQGHQGLGLTPVVTVGPGGIELRRSAQSGAPYATLAWSAVAYVHPEHYVIFNGRRSFPVLTMRVCLRGGGQPVEIPLPIMGRNGLMFAFPDQANFLLGAVGRYCTVA
ncbi:hypothetical protein [Arthrobacter sp. N199823]|uniref:hypothetical protein n=1 Tax=Arthrobacter sp. N199823 TaxID=2058895 RepID=UPI0011B04237|nr:hypothetical protein [Arthrobacter sp. N199823]